MVKWLVLESFLVKVDSLNLIIGAPATHLNIDHLTSSGAWEGKVARHDAERLRKIRTLTLVSLGATKP